MNDSEKLAHLVKMLRWYIRYHEDEDYIAEAIDLYGEDVVNDQHVTANFMKGWLKTIEER